MSFHLKQLTSKWWKLFNLQMAPKKIIIFLVYALIVMGASAWAGILEQNDFMIAICDKKTDIIGEVRGNKKILACQSCPSYTGLKGSKEEFQLDAVYYGSFSGPNEAVASMRGCESQADGSGETVLLKKVGTHWQRMSSTSSISMSECIPFTSGTKRTELFCMHSATHSGALKIWFSQVYFEGSLKKQKPALESLLFGSNSAGGSLLNGKCYDLSPEKMRLVKTDPLKISIKGSAGFVSQLSSDLPDCIVRPTKQFSFEIFTEYDGSNFVIAKESSSEIVKIKDFMNLLLQEKEKKIKTSECTEAGLKMIFEDNDRIEISMGKKTNSRCADIKISSDKKAAAWVVNCVGQPINGNGEAESVDGLAEQAVCARLVGTALGHTFTIDELAAQIDQLEYISNTHKLKYYRAPMHGMGTWVVYDMDSRKIDFSCPDDDESSECKKLTGR